MAGSVLSGRVHRLLRLWKTEKHITDTENPTISRMIGFVGFFDISNSAVNAYVTDTVKKRYAVRLPGGAVGQPKAASPWLCCPVQRLLVRHLRFRCSNQNRHGWPDWYGVWLRDSRVKRKPDSHGAQRYDHLVYDQGILLYAEILAEGADY